MTKRTIKWLFILVICLMFENVYATDSIYSINKNTDEKLFFIKESLNKNNENNGFVVGGTYLKEIIEADSKTIEDYQVMIRKMEELNGIMIMDYLPKILFIF